MLMIIGFLVKQPIRVPRAWIRDDMQHPGCKYVQAASRQTEGKHRLTIPAEHAGNRDPEERPPERAEEDEVGTIHDHNAAVICGDM